MNAIVLGGGVDAYVAARLFARARWDVVLVQEHEESGATAGWVPGAVARELGVDAKVEAPDPWLTVALPDGGRLELWRDTARSAEALRRLSPNDAEKWPDFCRRMARLARLLEDLYLAAPEPPTGLGFAIKLRRLGRQGMEDLMRLLPMSVGELLDDWFECDALKGALAAMGVLHLQQGPRSGGTAFRLLHHHVGSPEGVFRPPRSNFASVLNGGGASRKAQVKKILMKSGRATGIALASGEELAASVVISALDPRRTLLELADPAWLDPELARALSQLRRRGVVARVFFPNVVAPDLAFCPSLDYLERAYDESKYGRVSREPYFEVTPATRGVEVHFQYAPYELAEGSWDERSKSEIADAVRRHLARHVDGLDEASVLAPPDLEAKFGWPEGQAYHVELALDQALWMRPLPELARYRTPIEGLWLCGPGTHPGSGVAGASARNCVREILSTAKRS